MEKAKEMWAKLSKQGKIAVAGVAVIVLVIIISNIIA